MMLRRIAHQLLKCDCSCCVHGSYSRRGPGWKLVPIRDWQMMDGPILSLLQDCSQTKRVKDTRVVNKCAAGFDIPRKHKAAAVALLNPRLR